MYLARQPEWQPIQAWGLWSIFGRPFAHSMIGRRRALKLKGAPGFLQIGKIKGIVLLVPQPGGQERFWIVDLHMPGSDDADRLQVLGPKDSPKTALSCCIAGIVDETGHPAQILAGRTDGQDRRALRGMRRRCWPSGSNQSP